MSLVVAEDGPASRAILNVLSSRHGATRERDAAASSLAHRGGGVPPSGPAPCLASSAADDLFMQAIGHDALVYLATSSLLDGRLEPHPDPERARKVVRAARAPGVRLVVLVVPNGEGYLAEEAVLRKDGKPFVVLRCPPLIEEFSVVLERSGSASLALPTRGAHDALFAVDLGRAVVEALETEEQGRIKNMRALKFSPKELYSQASLLLPKPVRIRAVPRLMFWLLSLVRRLLRRPAPAPLLLLERLGSPSS